MYVGHKKAGPNCIGFWHGSGQKIAKYFSKNVLGMRTELCSTKKIHRIICNVLKLHVLLKYAHVEKKRKTTLNICLLCIAICQIKRGSFSPILATIIAITSHLGLVLSAMINL